MTWRERLIHFGEEAWRVRWMLMFSIGVIIARQVGALPSGALGLVLWKVSLASLGFVVAHIGWQQAMDYVDMERLYQHLLEEDDPDRADVLGRGLLAMACFRGIVYAAFIIGLTNGL